MAESGDVFTAPALGRTSSPPLNLAIPSTPLPNSSSWSKHTEAQTAGWSGGIGQNYSVPVVGPNATSQDNVRSANSPLREGDGGPYQGEVLGTGTNGGSPDPKTPTWDELVARDTSLSLGLGSTFGSAPVSSWANLSGFGPPLDTGASPKPTDWTQMIMRDTGSFSALGIPLSPTASSGGSAGLLGLGIAASGSPNSALSNKTTGWTGSLPKDPGSGFRTASLPYNAGLGGNFGSTGVLGSNTTLGLGSGSGNPLSSPTSWTDMLSQDLSSVPVLGFPTTSNTGRVTNDSGYGSLSGGWSAGGAFPKSTSWTDMLGKDLSSTPLLGFPSTSNANIPRLGDNGGYGGLLGMGVSNTASATRAPWMATPTNILGGSPLVESPTVIGDSPIRPEDRSAPDLGYAGALEAEMRASASTHTRSNWISRNPIPEESEMGSDHRLEVQEGRESPRTLTRSPHSQGEDVGQRSGTPEEEEN